MVLKTCLRQEVSFYPKLILGNISYDSNLVQELIYEINSDITQEELLNTVINITLNNPNRQIRQDTIKSFVPCLVDGALVNTFSTELNQLIYFFVRISNELFYILNNFINNADKMYFKYINWNSGDIVFSTFELTDEQSITFKQLFIDK